MTKGSSKIIVLVYGLHHMSLKVVILKIGLEHESSKVVKLEVGLHHGRLGKDQEVS